MNYELGNLVHQHPKYKDFFCNIIKLTVDINIFMAIVHRYRIDEDIEFGCELQMIDGTADIKNIFEKLLTTNKYTFFNKKMSNKLEQVYGKIIIYVTVNKNYCLNLKLV